MALTLAILGLISAFSTLIIWWVRRKAAEHDDPVRQQAERDEAIEHGIAAGAAGVDDINRVLDAGLRERLRALQAQDRGHPGGPPGPVSQGGNGLPGQQ